jgi:hypothetical protein
MYLTPGHPIGYEPKPGGFSARNERSPLHEKISDAQIKVLPKWSYDIVQRKAFQRSFTRLLKTIDCSWLVKNRLKANPACSTRPEAPSALGFLSPRQDKLAASLLADVPPGGPDPAFSYAAASPPEAKIQWGGDALLSPTGGGARSHTRTPHARYVPGQRPGSVRHEHSSWQISSGHGPGLPQRAGQAPPSLPISGLESEISFGDGDTMSQSQVDQTSESGAHASSAVRERIRANLHRLQTPLERFLESSLHNSQSQDGLPDVGTPAPVPPHVSVSPRSSRASQRPSSNYRGSPPGLLRGSWEVPDVSPPSVGLQDPEKIALREQVARQAP